MGNKNYRQANNLYLMKSNQKLKCHKCSRFPVNGDIFVVETETETSIDGKVAYRTIWICKSGGHLKVLGYTKPVDFGMKKERS